MLARIFHETALRDRGDGRATGQSRETAGLDPRRTRTVRRRIRGPRTPGRTTISVVAVTPGRDKIFGLGFQLQGLVFLSKGGLVEDETWLACHLMTF